VAAATWSGLSACPGEQRAYQCGVLRVPLDRANPGAGIVDLDVAVGGNLGADRIDGGPGDDRINVVHGERDRVVCGPGNDVVFVDPRDVVAGDCESVRR